MLRILSANALRLGRSSLLARPLQVKFQRKFVECKFGQMLISYSTNLTVKGSPSRVTPDQLPPIPAGQNLAPAPIDSSIDKWFFISGAAN